MTAGGQFHFELTFDDYQAAIVAHYAGIGATSRKGSTPFWQWLVIGIAICATLAIVGSAIHLPALEVVQPLLDAIQSHYFALAPWVIFLALSLSYSLAARLSQIQIAIGLGVLLTISLASGLAALIGDGLYVALPWFILLQFWHRAWSILVTQRTLKNQWQRLSQLHGPKNFRWDEDGFVMEEPAVTYVYRWNAITGWRETTTVLMLYVSASNFHILPIRAFPDAEMIKAIRDTIIETLKTRADARFPVILKQNPDLPLPAQPIVAEEHKPVT